jgi:hypothetical protein
VDTVTTIEAYEKSPSGAHVITLLGGTRAGTRDDTIAAIAQNVLAQDNPNPVAVRLHEEGGRVYLDLLEEITPPPDEPEDVAKTEAVAPGSDPTGEPKVESMETMIDSDQEIVQSEPLRQAANAVHIAHVLVNDLEAQLATIGLSHKLIITIQEKLGEAATELREARVD